LINQEYNMNQLDNYRRPEVKAIAQGAQSVWLGTAQGLYRLTGEHLDQVPEWCDVRINALAVSGTGLLVVVSRQDEQSICRTDAEGSRVETLPALKEDVIKSILCTEEQIIVGGKQGIYRLENAGWRRVYGQGHTEIIGLQRSGAQLLAFAKKQGSQMLPALLVSDDAGTSWKKVAETTYHDGILAAWDDLLLTRWRGLWKSGTPVKYEKAPFSVATEVDDRKAWVSGHKLVVSSHSGSKLELKDARFAEAEGLVLLPDAAIVAGINGAFRVALGTGHITDLFASERIKAEAAKIKKLWQLDEGRLLATASYGAFLSDDQGRSWQVSDAQWSVLDAEGLALSPDDAWYMATQRALFVSWDNGGSWQQVKLATQPHFAEMTALTFCADRLVLGTKAGLFISEPGKPKEMRQVAAAGAGTVHALLSDSRMRVWVGMTDGRLLRVDSQTHEVEVLAQFSAPCAPLVLRGADLLLISQKTLYQVNDRAVEAIAPPHADLMFTSGWNTAKGLLLWNHQTAWSYSSDGLWQQLPEWMAGVKSVTGSDHLYLTDRHSVMSVGH